MPRKLTIKTGNTTIILPNNLGNEFQNVIQKLLPNTKRELFDLVERIENDAREDWPIRRKRNGRIDHKNTQNSRKRVYSEVVINSDFSISGRVGNDADYAWAIRVGARTPIDIPYNRKIASELLHKPMRRATNKMIKTFADEAVKVLKE